MKPPSSRARLWSSLLCLGSALAVSSRAQDDAVPPTEPPPGAAVDEEAAEVAEELREARQILADAAEDVPILAVHAKTLLDAGDLPALRSALTGSKPKAALGVLQALAATGDPDLLPELIAVAAVSPSTEVALLAMQTLERLADAREEIVALLVQRIAEGTLPSPQLETIVLVLGRSRDLAAVQRLIGELDGPRAVAANHALENLTGHQLGVDAGAEAWEDFWAEHSHMPRDVLLERALETERASNRLELSRMRDEVERARIARMGQDVDRLTAGLSDDFLSVRLAAARALGSHPNVEQAANAVPRLLARLGYGQGPPPVNGTNGSHDVGAHEVEPDAEVRAAIVDALGRLGRGDPAVQSALLQELSTSSGAEATAAMNALGQVRGEPGVVGPLLDYLGHPELGEEAQVTALGVIADNGPDGELRRLLPWLDDLRPPAVRAGAVRAVMASTDLEAALDGVAGLAAPDEVRDVRYALAVALGDRVRGLDSEHSARSRILPMLARLIADVDPSVRAEAASSLGDTQQPGALSILEERSRAETDESVMVRILDAFGELRLPDGMGIIGRVCASWRGEGRQVLDAAARRALVAIGEGQDVTGWLSMAETLRQVSAYELAAWCLRDTLQRHAEVPADREVVAQVRGMLAEVLWQAGQADEARTLLVELHEAGAPYPSHGVRLDLLARTSEQLGHDAAAADYFLERLEQLPEGDSTRIETRRNAARTLVKAARWDDAMTHVAALHDLDPSDNELLYWMGQAQAALGESSRAANTLGRLLERIPDEDEAFRAEVRAALVGLQGPDGGLPFGGEEGAPGGS